MTPLKSGKVHPAITALILVFLIIGLLAWLILGKGCKKDPGTDLVESVPEQVKETVVPEAQPAEVEIESPEEIPKVHMDPAALMTQLKSSLLEGNEQQLKALLEKSNLKADEVAKLLGYIEGHAEKDFTIREVGEVEINKVSRWAVKAEGATEEFTLDVRRLPNGEWQIEGVNLAGLDHSAKPKDADSLSAADSFIKAVLEQDFKHALTYADAGSLSEARIASLALKPL